MEESKTATEVLETPLTEIDAVLERARETARNRAVEVQSQAKRKRLRPRHEWVIIRKVEAKDRLYSSGLVITEGQARSSLGEVVSVARAAWWEKLFGRVHDLKRGDLVVYTNFAIQLQELEDATGEKNLFLVREEEIYSVLDDEG